MIFCKKKKGLILDTDFHSVSVSESGETTLWWPTCWLTWQPTWQLAKKMANMEMDMLADMEGEKVADMDDMTNNYISGKLRMSA